ncbi:DUF368 domain-containing protein [Mycoplasmatota bacterium]|nr:DUF368 domain-containing protein [Mycoplasmatota bacterium]
MIKTFFGGVIIGIANIIPGVSGGTMMVLMGMYDKTLGAISNLLNVDNKNRVNDFSYLFIIFIGAIIGAVSFANILNILFLHLEVQTYYFFIGLIVSSLLVFSKKEFNNYSIDFAWLLFGSLVILSTQFLTDRSIFFGLPDISINLILVLILVGMVAGASMIIPGVSGSLILLVLGKYHLIKAYVANLFSLKFEILFPLFVFGIGTLIGIYLTARLTKEMLRKYRRVTLSFIIGMILASIIILIPRNNYNLFTISTSLATLGIGFYVVRIINK